MRYVKTRRPRLRAGPFFCATIGTSVRPKGDAVSETTEQPGEEAAAEEGAAEEGTEATPEPEGDEGGGDEGESAA